MNLIDPPPALAVTHSIEPLVDPVFISDLHLTPQRPATMRRFFRFMQADAPGHRELVILGDLFEFWIGDDASPPAKPVIDALAAASNAGQRIFLMHGNRDPLLGHDFADAAGATLLADPIVAEVAGTPTLLSHGDVWCTSDVAYQQYRAMVKNPAAQRDFLAKSVDERIAVPVTVVVDVAQLGVHPCVAAAGIPAEHELLRRGGAARGGERRGQEEAVQGPAPGAAPSLVGSRSPVS